MALFITVALGIWGLEHLYVGWRLLSLPCFAGGLGRRALLVLLAGGFLAYPAERLLWHAWRFPLAPAVEWLGAVWIGALFLLVAFLLLADLVSLGGLAGAGPTVVIRTTAVFLALLAAGLGLHGGLKRPKIVRVEVPLPGLPRSLDGLQILHVSDLHLGTLTGRRFLDSLTGLALGLDPDLLVITGDLFDSEAEAVEELVPGLQRLRAPLGVYAVLGNHEYYAGASRCARLMEAAGFAVLQSSAAEVAPGLWLVGVPDREGARQTGRPAGDLEAAMEAIPGGAAVILLQHAPEREAEAAASGGGRPDALRPHPWGPDLALPSPGPAGLPAPRRRLPCGRVDRDRQPRRRPVGAAHAAAGAVGRGTRHPRPRLRQDSSLPGGGASRIHRELTVGVPLVLRHLWPGFRGSQL